MAKTRTRAKPAQRGYVPAVPLRLVDDAIGFLELDIDRGRLTPREVFEQMEPLIRGEAGELADLQKQLDDAVSSESDAARERDEMESERDHFREGLEALIGEVRNLAEKDPPEDADPAEKLAHAEAQFKAILSVLIEYDEPHKGEWHESLSKLLTERRRARNVRRFGNLAR